MVAGPLPLGSVISCYPEHCKTEESLVLFISSSLHHLFPAHSTMIVILTLHVVQLTAWGTVRSTVVMPGPLSLRQRGREEISR